MQFLAPVRRRRSRRIASLVAGVAGLAAAAGAWAGDTNGFGVATAATVGDPYPFIRSVSAYRTGQDSSGNYTLARDTPPVAQDQCPALAGSGFVCTTTLGGTSSPGYDDTASTSSAALTTSLVAGSADLLQSRALARADLASATLGVEAVTGYRHGAQAFASFADTLSFRVAGAGASTVTLITVKLSLDGSLAAQAGLSSIDDNLQFGNASARAVHTAYGSLFGDRTDSAFFQGGWVSYSWDANTPENTRFTGVYALVGDAPVLGLGLRLIGAAGNHVSSALYGNTSTLRLELPAEVSYTSASGVFMTSAVPEPASVALWALGLGGLGLWSGRRRASARLQWAHARRTAPVRPD